MTIQSPNVEPKFSPSCPARPRPERMEVSNGRKSSSLELVPTDFVFFKGKPTQGSRCMKNTDRTLQLVNDGVQLYFGVENATCFKWLQHVSFKEPCNRNNEIQLGGRGGPDPKKKTHPNGTLQKNTHTTSKLSKVVQGSTPPLVSTA